MGETAVTWLVQTASNAFFRFFAARSMNLFILSFLVTVTVSSSTAQDSDMKSPRFRDRTARTQYLLKAIGLQAMNRYLDLMEQFERNHQRKMPGAHEDHKQKFIYTLF